MGTYDSDEHLCINCEHAVNDRCRHWRGGAGSCGDFWPHEDFLAEVKAREAIEADELVDSGMWPKQPEVVRDVA